MKANKGFTLLEVLVAISIFAVIGLGANQMLRTIIDTHEKTSVKIESMSTLTRAFAALERDIAQAVPRFVRDEFGDPLPPLMVNTGPYILELTRTGWSNPINLPRSNLQRVSYTINEDNELIRRFWLVVDRAEDSEPVEQTILEGVEDLRISLLVEDGNTTNLWPDADHDSLLPRSVEVVLQTESTGELRKVYSLVDLIGINTQRNGNGGQDSGDDETQDENGNLLNTTEGELNNQGTGQTGTVP